VFVVKPKRQSSFEDLVTLFKGTPAWAGPLAAGLVFTGFKFVGPLLIPASLMASGSVSGLLRTLLGLFAWVFSGIILFAWAVAEAWKLSNRGLFLTQNGIDSVRGLTWRQFERLVCEAFRRQGYKTALVGDDGTEGGDGGVDIELRRGPERVLVQCKQWRAIRVGVATVRELMGVVAAQGATRGIVVTSGCFTREAMKFARSVARLELMDGLRLERLIRHVRAKHSAALKEGPPPATEERPTCRYCGSVMVMRIARTGVNAGTQFWGCLNFPKCRHTEDASTDDSDPHEDHRDEP
jgi:restriction system protein